MDELQEKINNLKHMSPNLDYYNNLLMLAAKFHEMKALVYVYDHMKLNSIQPNKISYEHINKLHSKHIYESKKIILNVELGNKLEPRRRIHKIMKGYNYTDNYQNALIHKDKVINYLNNNDSVRSIDNRIELSKKISKNCGISFNDARYIVTSLKRSKFFEKNISKKQNKIESYFNVQKG